MRQLVYVGTYAEQGEGIFIYELDATTGVLTRIGANSAVNPSYLTIAADHKFLYAVHETSDFAGQSGGGVSAFALDASSGALQYLNSQPTHGAHPCYISLDKGGRWALVANYSGGNVTVLPVNADGTLGAPSAVVQHEGHSGVHPGRQEAPHAHSVIVDPVSGNVLAADLGLDKVLIYQLNTESGTLTAQAALETKPGAGPRHLAFHPGKRLLYCINELDSTVTLYDYSTKQAVQTVSALPDDFSGENTCADIHVHPSGKFLYASNRGHDSIAVFAVEPETGRLTSQQFISTQGKIPRNFALDQSGTILLAANQNSDSIVTYKIDADSGQLTPTGHVTQVVKPVCVKVIQPPA